jgi:hypothetical protein
VVEEAGVMTFLFVSIVLGGVSVACVKAYLGAKLLEKDQDAWEKFQVAEDMKRRRRQEFLGKATLAGVRWVSDLWKGGK